MGKQKSKSGGGDCISCKPRSFKNHHDGSFNRPERDDGLFREALGKRGGRGGSSFVGPYSYARGGSRGGFRW